MIFKKSLYLGGKKRCPTHWNPLWNAVHELCFYMWKFVNSYRSLDPSATISKPSSFKSIIISAESSELLADAKFSRAFFELREHCCFFFLLWRSGRFLQSPPESEIPIHHHPPGSQRSSKSAWDDFLRKPCLVGYFGPLKETCDFWPGQVVLDGATNWCGHMKDVDFIWI